MKEVRPHPPIIRFGVFELDLEAGELHKNGLKVKLHDQPFQILAMLLERPGRLVSWEELQKRLWPADTFVDFEPSLNAAVKKLRQALGDDADNPRFVETLPRRGYRFIYPVESVATRSSSPSAAAAVDDSRKVPALAERRYRAQRRWVVLVGTVTALTVVAMAIAFNVAGLRNRVMRAVGAVREPPLQIHSIAVLPLENLSGDPEQDYFADGMTDELITRLAQIRAVRVISRTSVMQYKGAKKATAEIARELNVDAVVEGAVLRSGDRVRITAQLVHAPSDRHLWAESYERDLRDVLALESQVAHAVATEIRIKLTPQEQIRLAAARPINPETYDAYLRGQYYIHRLTSEGMKKAVDYFTKATTMDPTYAPAYASLAYTYAWGGSDFLSLAPERPTTKRRRLRLER